MKNKNIFIVLLCSICLLSCQKWLDIQPQSEVEKDRLFTTEDGFKEALLGIYTRCANGDLYGKELTIGTPEVLVQNYTIPNNDPLGYQKTARFDYDDGAFKDRKDNIWKGLYHGIVNANLLLAEIDSKRNLFVGDNYALIKGEALALRAFLHFDALRLFAPAPIVNAQADAIPYVTKYSNKTTPLSKVSAVLDSVIADLVVAKDLLKVDPIRSAGYVVGYPTVNDTLENSELSNNSLFLQNRRHRLNYYAVCGALARVYLYKGDKPKALANAMEVIVSKKFPWTNNTDFQSVKEDKKDRILYKELLFAWYIPGMSSEYNQEWFGTGRMNLDKEEGRTIYEVGGNGGGDLRYTQWFGAVSVGTTALSALVKYNRNTFSDNFEANLHYLMAPAIRLSELYYIAAECNYESNPTLAAEYLNQVRIQRGIGEPADLSTATKFRTELLKEYRKEMYAEGQLYYAYKRLNAPIIGEKGTVIPASQKIFVWPLPSDEIIYGQR